VIWALNTRLPTPPPANSDAITVARFVANEKFHRFPERQRRTYAHQLRLQSDQLKSALASGQLSQQEYESGVLCAWMDRQLDHMDAYYQQPEARREQFLLERQQQKSASGGSTKADTSMSNSAERQFVDRWGKNWPSEQWQKWDAYREASKKAKSAATKPSVAGR
jgi:hypothetical protein